MRLTEVAQSDEAIVVFVDPPEGLLPLLDGGHMLLLVVQPHALLHLGKTGSMMHSEGGPGTLDRASCFGN